MTCITDSQIREQTEPKPPRIGISDDNLGVNKPCVTPISIDRNLQASRTMNQDSGYKLTNTDERTATMVLVTNVVDFSMVKF